MVGLDADVGSYVPLSVDSSVNRGLGDSVRDAIADISFQGVTVSGYGRTVYFCSS